MCIGRSKVLEEESLRAVPMDGSQPLPKPSKVDTVSIPQCTVEGVGYLLECWTCRLEGKLYKYVEEISRSPYQRRREHVQEIEHGRKNHAVVMHFNEVHNGIKQEILMRVVKHARTAMERQGWDSIQIDALATHPDRCLNLK